MTTFFNEPTVNQYPIISLNHEYEPQRFLHLITPCPKENQTKRYPLVVFIANNQEQLHLAPLTKFSQHGFTIAIVPAEHFSTTHQSVCAVKTALRFLLLHATQFMIDTNRIFLWGENYGAEIGAQAILTANSPEWNNEDARVLPLHFRAGILFGLNSFKELTAMIPSHKRPPLYIYNGENDELDHIHKDQFIQAYKQTNQLSDFIMKNTVSGSAAFYTPYLLTTIEQQIKENL